MWYRIHLTGFKLTMLVVIGIDCKGSYKSNYHMITTTTAPYLQDHVRKVRRYQIRSIKSTDRQYHGQQLEDTKSEALNQQTDNTMVNS